MTKATHTPGPWKTFTDKYRGMEQLCIIPAQDDDHSQGPLHIANINPCLLAESDANAALLATAPELLEALECMLKWAELSIKPLDPERLPKGFEAWQAVARKARGDNE